METPLPSTPPPPCCSPKSKLVCVSAGLVVLVIVAIASFFLGRTSAKPSSLPQVLPKPTASPILTPTSNETTDWKTYTNVEYRYQINFPSQISQRPIYDFEKNKEYVSMGVPNSDAIVIDIKVMKNLSKVSIKNWWTESFDDIYGIATNSETIASQKDFLTEEKVVNNLKALRVIPLPPACNSLRYIGDQYFFPKNGYVVWVNFYHDPINCEYVGLQLGEKLKAQILSTFKFLE